MRLCLILFLSTLLFACSNPTVDDPAPVEQSTEQSTEQSLDDYADAMAHEHADDNAEPNEATLGRVVDGVISSEAIYFQGAKGPVSGFLARPEAAKPRATVVMIHEWWGLNDNIRSMAKILASEGYAVLAVDLYEGSQANTPEQAREQMATANQRPEALEANLAAAVAYLQNEFDTDAVAVLGWCFGGAWTLNIAAKLGGQIDAAVVYYGRVPTTTEAVANVSAPVLGIFAAEDTGIPLESVRAFEKAMNDADKSLELHIFPDVGHAFANPSGNNYNAPAATAAWQLTLDFLAAQFPSP